MFAWQVFVHTLNVTSLLQLVFLCIYTQIESKHTCVDFIKRLRMENDFNDRCGKFKIDSYDIKVT